MMKDQYDISFISMIPGLEKIDECIPKPISKYIPEWWKTMEIEGRKMSIDGLHGGNIKTCPSFPDYFSQGYIMPMWTDTILKYDSDQQTFGWRTATEKFFWDVHRNDQYLDHVDHKFFGKKSYLIVKTHCPWRIVSNEKYMMYQLPTFFHFNEDFSVVPGVRDVGVYHDMNIQFVIHSDKKEIFIPRGTPIAHFIPIKKETDRKSVV